MRQIMFAAALVAAAPATAELRSASPQGFESVHVATIAAPPARVFEALGLPALWWNKDHTYSGDAANLRIDPVAGGCFCEKVPADGSTIEHGRIVYAQPGKVLRLSGALGPLQAEGVSATLTWTLKPAGPGTEIVQSYVVGGYVRGGADKYAAIVDQVLGEQLKGLQAHFDKR